MERPLLAIIGHRGGVGEPLSQVGRRDGQLDLKLVQSPRSKELKKKKINKPNTSAINEDPRINTLVFSMY